MKLSALAFLSIVVHMFVTSVIGYDEIIKEKIDRVGSLQNGKKLL